MPWKFRGKGLREGNPSARGYLREGGTSKAGLIGLAFSQEGNGHAHQLQGEKSTEINLYPRVALPKG